MLPVFPPLQATFVCEVVTLSIAGSAMLIVAEAVQPLKSVTVNV